MIIQDFDYFLGTNKAIISLRDQIPAQELIVEQIFSTFEEIDVLWMPIDFGIALAPQHNAGLAQVPAKVLKHAVN